MSIQKELEKWAEDTVKEYHKIAIREDVNMAYYTQSDLSLLSCEPELMIVGINPGSESSYKDQCKNKNWSYLYNNPLDKNHLLKGNYCKEEGKPSSWDGHRKWKYWTGLKKCLSQTTLSKLLDDDSKIIISNASFFSTPKANGIKESLLLETIKYTLDLIDKTKPRNLIFLSGKKCFERLSRLTVVSKSFQFEYKHICGNIYVGILNNKLCIGIPHPTYKTREEIKLVASVLPFLLRYTNYEDIDGELICKECDKQIKEYEVRIFNKKKSIDTQVKELVKISNLKSSGKGINFRGRMELFKIKINSYGADNCNLHYRGRLLNYEFYTNRHLNGKYIYSKDTIAVDLLIDDNEFMIRLGTRRNSSEKSKEVAIAVDGEFRPGNTTLTAPHWHIYKKMPLITSDDEVIHIMNELLEKIKAYRNKEFQK